MTAAPTRRRAHGKVHAPQQVSHDRAFLHGPLTGPDTWTPSIFVPPLCEPYSKRLYSLQPMVAKMQVKQQAGGGVEKGAGRANHEDALRLPELWSRSCWETSGLRPVRSTDD